MPVQRDARGRFTGKAGRSSVAGAGVFAAAGATADGRADMTIVTPSEPFLAELQADWARHGAATIDKVRNERPHDYLRLVASSLAKQAESKTDPIMAMSDDEVADELRTILEQLAASGADPGA